MLLRGGGGNCQLRKLCILALHPLFHFQFYPFCLQSYLLVLSPCCSLSLSLSLSLSPVFQHKASLHVSVPLCVIQVQLPPTAQRKASLGSTRSLSTRIDRSWHKERWSFLQFILRLRFRTSFTRCKYQRRRNKRNSTKFKY